jgi:hypothetical protein
MKVHYSSARLKGTKFNVRGRTALRFRRIGLRAHRNRTREAKALSARVPGEGGLLRF